MGLGERLVILRNRLGLTQTEAAQQLGIHRMVLGNYEAGRAELSFRRALAISKLYGAEIEVLAGKMEMPPPGDIRPRRRRDQDE
jgi:transcriptional regulator with XRE-family HTH domain